MSTDPSPEEYDRLAELIGSDQSPVGIDAKKTHILILHRLAAIEARLQEMEARLGQGRAEGTPAD